MFMDVHIHFATVNEDQFEVLKYVSDRVFPLLKLILGVEGR